MSRAESAVSRAESAVSRAESAVSRAESAVSRAESAVSRVDSAMGHHRYVTLPESALSERWPAAWGARVVVAPIVAYRRWISPALPARCRFYPSCSAYALEAITVHGPVRGTALAIWRLLRCQPFHPGGYDPVPPARTPRAG